MYKNLVIVILLSSAMQITCEVDNRVYHEKTDTYESYRDAFISCVKNKQGEVHCYRMLSNASGINEMVIDDSCYFDIFKRRYEAQQAAKKSE